MTGETIGPDNILSGTQSDGQYPPAQQVMGQNSPNQKGNAAVEAHLSAASGEKIPFLFTGYKYTQEDVNYLIGIGIDISKRVNAENEKASLIEKLQESLSKIKKLSGLLAICCSCKKIRDDKGYWKQLELFIRDHSEAEFTHSICPECARKLYPGMTVSKAELIQR